MKKYLIIIIALCISGNALAGPCMFVTCDAQPLRDPFCASDTFKGCVQGTSYPVTTCDVCKDGYNRVSKKGTQNGCSYYYDICERGEVCTGCSNCTSDTSWTAHSFKAGVEQKTTRTCSCNTCNSSTSYRCKAGYYGSGSNCTVCPSGGTSAAGSSIAITSCYKTSGSDTSGKFSFTPSCYYSN